MVRSCLAASLVLFGVFVWPGAAVADTRAALGGVPSASDLHLTVTVGHGATAKTRDQELFCEPLGGGHPHGEAACHDLDVAGGNFNSLPGDRTHGVCSSYLHYDPVTIAASGSWKYMPVTYTKTYGNWCKVKEMTGLVFVF
jgi:Subtilisin inhibitor-like